MELTERFFGPILDLSGESFRSSSETIEFCYKFNKNLHLSMREFCVFVNL